MTPQITSASALRKLIGDVGFPFGVRLWRDGEVSVDVGYAFRAPDMADHLHKLGFNPRIAGKPGTEGSRILIVQEGIKS